MLRHVKVRLGVIIFLLCERPCWFKIACSLTSQRSKRLWFSKCSGSMNHLSFCFLLFKGYSLDANILFLHRVVFQRSSVIEYCNFKGKSMWAENAKCLCSDSPSVELIVCKKLNAGERRGWIDSHWFAPKLWSMRKCLVIMLQEP